MLQRKLFWIYGAVTVLLIMNYATGLIPISFSSGTSAIRDIYVLCYNVRCSDVDYQKNQIGIANEILSESPDVVFFASLTDQ